MMASTEPTLNDLYSPSKWTKEDPQKVVETFANNEMKTAEFVELKHGKITISYGDDDKQKIDIFGRVEGQRKMVILLHGGYWQEGNKNTFTCPAIPCLERNIPVACVGYRLASLETSLHTTVEDTVSGIQKVLSTYTVNDVTLMGHSAGAHLAFLAACSLQSSRITKLVFVTGVFNIKELVDCEIGQCMRLTNEEACALSCNADDLGKLTVKTLFINVEHDAPKLREQQKKMIEELSPLVHVQTYDVPGMHHFNVVPVLKDSNQDLTKNFIAFIES